VNNESPVYTLDVGGTFGCNSGQIYSDGSGNLSAQTFNPISDRARKEKIVTLSPTNALAMALALQDYSWRFKARTNATPTVVQIPTSLSTNLVSVSRTNAAGKIVTRTHLVVVTNSFILATNLSQKVFAASGTEFGPMAQDWHAVTGLGGGSNISLTAMSGLFLGAVQGLALNQNVFTNASGARFSLRVNVATNGFTFVPQ
jgi:hypothetical protein